MKRPFAVIGFSMLIISLLIIKLSLKMTIALIFGAVVIFCFLWVFKIFRRNKTILFALVAVIIYAVSFLVTEIDYYKAKEQTQERNEFTGSICETPKSSDYAFTYIVKLDGENYRIRYVTQKNEMLSEGDRVKVKAVISQESYNEDFFENSLASKIYFTVFGCEENSIEKTGERDFYYSTVGKIRNWYSTVVDTYLPNEIGAIAKAMTIGDKSELSWNTLEKFNYAGVSHILVISGLHLSVWIVGILKILEKFCKSDKMIGIAGLTTLFVYSALVGFTPSIVRAGMMVGMVLLGKLLSREADSTNSVGIAVALILIVNPFSVMSASFWFTVLSTMGLLILPNRIIDWVKTRKHTEFIFKNKMLYAFLNLVAVSVSISVFTLPIFIVRFEMIPVASLISNLLIVDFALLMMVLTVVAVLCHGIHLLAFSRIVFLLVGVLGNIIKFLAEKIGMAQWSTLSVSHVYFKYFLVIAIVCVCVALLVKRKYKELIKHVATALGVVFILLSVYTTYFDYSNPSVDVMFTDHNPIILVNSHGKTVLVGLQEGVNIGFIKSMMYAHNKKSLDGIIVCDEMVSLSTLTTLYDELGKTESYFYGKSPQLLHFNHNDNTKSLTVGDHVEIDVHSNKEIAITSKNKKILLLDCDENVFKNSYDYDIITLYGENVIEDYEHLISCVDTNKTEIIVAEKKDSFTIYFEQ